MNKHMLYVLLLANTFCAPARALHDPTRSAEALSTMEPQAVATSQHAAAMTSTYARLLAQRNALLPALNMLQSLGEHVEAETPALKAEILNRLQEALRTFVERRIRMLSVSGMCGND